MYKGTPAPLRCRGFSPKKKSGKLGWFWVMYGLIHRVISEKSLLGLSRRLFLKAHFCKAGKSCGNTRRYNPSKNCSINSVCAILAS